MLNHVRVMRDRSYLVLAVALGLLATKCTSSERPTVKPAAPADARASRSTRVPEQSTRWSQVEFEFDGRHTPDTSYERNTHSGQGFAPIADRMAGRRVEVATMREFVGALGSNRTILMKPGIYVWGDGYILGSNTSPDEPYEDTESYEGLSTHYRDGAIHDVENLTIAGLDGGARILQPDGYDHVLAFHDTRGLTLYNLVLGHHTDVGGCAGGVVRIVGGEDIVLDGLDMFGSGTEGLTLLSVRDLELRHSVVWGCSEQLSTVFRSTGIRISDTTFRDNGPDLLRGFDVAFAKVVFDGVTIRDNRVGVGGGGDYGSLFSLASDYAELPGIREDAPTKIVVEGPAEARVVFSNGVIVGNHFDRLTDAAGSVTVEDSRVSNIE